jgi:hypothetical protein
MSNDISVQAGAVARAGGGGAINPKMAATNPLPAQVESGPPPSPIISPTLRLEVGLGLVVIEFRSHGGTITTSIPSQRQLAAYQRWAQTHAGQAPGEASAAGAAPQGTISGS